MCASAGEIHTASFSNGLNKSKINHVVFFNGLNGYVNFSWN